MDGSTVDHIKIFHDLASGASSLAAAALALARSGLAVFPCAPRGKEPLLSKEDGGNGCHDATCDLFQAEYWWSEHPDANIGICPGKCKPPLIVLDADAKGGKRGLETLAELEREGLIPANAPRVRTPSGGIHIYLRLPEGTPPIGNASPFKDVDLRSSGGYVLAPPSVVAGQPYELLP